MRETLALLGSQVPFRPAARLLDHLSGLTVGAETIRRVSEAAGADHVAQAAVTAVIVAQTQESAEPGEAAPGTLLVETDGGQVPFLDGWHEVKVGLVGGVVDGVLTDPSYLATRLPVEQFGPQLVAEAARRGALEVVQWHGPVTAYGCLAELRSTVILGDGAPWIWNLAADHFGERTEIVDDFHASEHLWAAAKASFGEGTAEATPWAEAQTHLLWKQGSLPVQAALAALTAPTAEATDLLRRERGYFRAHTHRMDYPSFRAQGFPIGSGAIEGACKHLVQRRMKRAGMRWSHDGGQAILALCARDASNRSLLRAA